MTRCDVVVHGLGLAGRAVFARLVEVGVDVVGFDPVVGWVRPGTEPLWAPNAAGLRLPCHLELPNRFLLSMGRAGVELVQAVDAHAGPGKPTPVDWRHPDAEPQLTACRALGLRAEAIPGGFRLLDGSTEVDLPVGVAPAEPAEEELTVWASGFGGEPWLADKVMPVRWQSIEVQRGLPTISRSGSVFSVEGRLWGARWASRHGEVGETERVPNPTVTAMLERLAVQDGVALPPRCAPAAPIAEIVFDSCDGLPIVGPIPGRPREGVICGFGVAGRTYLRLAVDHLVGSMLAGDTPRLPACLGTARFR